MKPNMVSSDTSRIEWHDKMTVCINIPTPKVTLSDSLNGCATIVDEEVIITPLAAMDALAMYLRKQYEGFHTEQLSETYPRRVKALLDDIKSIRVNW